MYKNKENVFVRFLINVFLVHILSVENIFFVTFLFLYKLYLNIQDLFYCIMFKMIQISEKQIRIRYHENRNWISSLKRHQQITMSVDLNHGSHEREKK